MKKIFLGFLFLLLALPLYAGNKNDLAYLGFDELDTASSVDAADEIVLFESDIPKQGKTVGDLSEAIASETETLTNKTFDANGTGNSLSNVQAEDFANEDWGDVSASSGSVTIDADVIDSANFADEDWGDVSVSTNSVTLDSGVVDTAELADDAVTSGKIAQGVIQTASVDLSSSDITNLNTSPKELVAAPGSGYVIEFISAVLILDYGTGVYDTNGNLSIETGATGTTLSDTVAEGDFLFNSADSIVVVQALSADEQLDANESLVLSCATGDPATGDSTMTAKITYRILETGL